MERTDAKELLHIKAWPDRTAEIVARDKDAYLSDDLLQEAGDSLMRKLGEAANRLARRGVASPEGVEWAVAVASRNFIVHRYDEIPRELTWQTLAVDLPGLDIGTVAIVRPGRGRPARTRLTLRSPGQPLTPESPPRRAQKPSRTHLPP